MVVRTYEDECQFIEKLTPYSYRIKKGFQPNMNVEGVFYVNEVSTFDDLSSFKKYWFENWCGSDTQILIASHNHIKQLVSYELIWN